MFTLNDSTVIAEISALHDAYERAIVANDIPALNAFFWDSPGTARFGVSEHLYGYEAIAAYRQSNAPIFTDRKLVRRIVTALGTEVASVMCEISQKIGGKPRQVRQSQVWARFPEGGWKIIAAHVSNPTTSPVNEIDWAIYLDHAAKAIGLPLNPVHRAGVAQNLQRASAIAAPLLATVLPEDTEAASIFTP